ncbi:PREDICTED: putative uncharacterized protein DDB_G0286901 [Vollenhovia emeryi]|uniref:putative uncharacterized protein DDB_G0286901 n=1 Tax=Vollenhovia emeryi TaxID=411798 RepID=UPI0005F36057|nr:PREDICTED: putative uncharacterized protein DDB_G0286901 [Vollenhovia emeryi]
MPSATISRRVLGYLLLAVLSQYGDAGKTNYLESILASLQRLESILDKQEQNTMSCLVPAQKLFQLLSEYQTSGNESNEAKANGQDSVALRRGSENENANQQLSELKKPRHRRKNRRNENANTNVNENINANVNANRYHRRALSDADPYSSSNNNMNSNMNSNVNLNSNLNKNRADLFDFSDEDDEI